MVDATILDLTSYQEVFDFTSHIEHFKKNEKFEKKFIEKVIPEIKK
jgi:hypothetical protein